MFHKLKEINWLYKVVDDDSVDKSAKKVIEVCDSATGEMIEKVTPQDVAGFQAFTIRYLDQKNSQSVTSITTSSSTSTRMRLTVGRNTWTSCAFLWKPRATLRLSMTNHVFAFPFAVCSFPFS